jgi:hypothetical protein
MCGAYARYGKEGIGWKVEGNGLSGIHQLSWEDNIKMCNKEGGKECVNGSVWLILSNI